MRVLIIALLFIGFISCNKSEDDNKATVVNDSISMGPGYANDIYYSLKNGIVSTAPRNNWDIGFKTNPRSSSIIINSTMGVKLWQYAGDTTKWNTLDTAGLKTSWVSLLDSDTTWSLSAFESSQTGHPNYGWGEYNAINHDVVGTALFVIQLQDKSFKKIWIKKRAAATNTYTFTYADLNGSNVENKSVVTGNFLTKNFVFFNLTNGSVVDREPVQTEWDVMLTKYYENIYNTATSSYIPYNVTGFLQNEGVTVAEVTGDVASNNYSGQKFNTAISIIGSDWKSFDMNSNLWSLKPDVKYFVNTKSNNIYKLVFKKFEGSSTGKVVFEKTKLK